MGSVLMLTGCGKTLITPGQLSHHHFVLIEVDGSETGTLQTRQMTPDLDFGAHLYLSATVCGTFQGIGEIYNNQLTVSQLSFESASCENRNAKRWEQAVRQVLETPNIGLKLNNNRLTVSNSQHTLTYIRRDWL